jgi:hypothetical protein
LKLIEKMIDVLVYLIFFDLVERKPEINYPQLKTNTWSKSNYW